MAFSSISGATFAHNNILSRADALEKPPKNEWRLIEAKSSAIPQDAPV